jgi:hypothetical protein
MLKGKLASRAFCINGRWHPYQNFRKRPAAALLRSQVAGFHGGKTVRLN